MIVATARAAGLLNAFKGALRLAERPLLGHYVFALIF